MARWGYPDSHWQAVADTYRTVQHAPSKRVAEVFNIPLSTAWSWVRKARSKGFLTEGYYKDYITDNRLRRVAEECGIDPEVLRAAVAKHAPGVYLVRETSNSVNDPNPQSVVG